MFTRTLRSSKATAVASFALATAFCSAIPAYAAGVTPITLTVSNSSITSGTGSATLTTKVAYSGVTPTGTLTTNVDGGTAVGASCYIQSAGVAICNSTVPTGSLSAGSHTINASYPGDATYAAGTGTGTLTVGPASTATLNVTNTSVSLGTASATLALTGTFNGPPPSGQVTFKVDNGSTVTANCSVTSNTTGMCSASYPTGALTSGSHTITASLGSDAKYNATTATGTLSITGTTYSLAISVNAVTVPQGTAATLNSSATYNGPTPGANGYFFSIDGGAALTANCTVNSSTNATCTGSAATGALSKGAHTITFTVNADSNYAQSSGSNTLTVQ